MQTLAGQAAIDSIKLLQSGQISGEDYTLGLHARGAEMDARLTEMMLTHELVRLKQIVVQKHMARAGTVNAILSNDISQRLSITEAQRKQFGSFLSS